MYQIRPNVAMIEVGIAIAAMIVERRLPRKSSTTSAARIEPTTRCSSTLSIDASMNSDVIADDADVVAGRQRRPALPSSRSLTAVDDFDGVGARLPADLQQDRAVAVEVGDGLGLGLAVLDPRDVADADRMAVLLAHDDVVELRDASGRGRACGA